MEQPTIFYAAIVILALAGEGSGINLIEFDDYLKCGLLEYGFLRVKCDGCRHEHLGFGGSGTTTGPRIADGMSPESKSRYSEDCLTPLTSTVILA